MHTVFYKYIVIFEVPAKCVLDNDAINLTISTNTDKFISILYSLFASIHSLKQKKLMLQIDRRNFCDIVHN